MSSHDEMETENEVADVNGLFGDEDETENNEQQNEVADGETNPTGATPAPAKKRKVINRLQNLNEKYMTDHFGEGIHKVNGYFENFKFKQGKDSEEVNLNKVLKRFEYFGQQCYPKLCFQDFVEKVEKLSKKKMIKSALLEIREKGKQKHNNSDNPPQVDQNDNLFGEEIRDNQLDENQTTKNNESTNIESTDEQNNTILSDEAREMILRKRQQAIERRKRKLEESQLNMSLNSSLNASQTTIS